MSTLIQLIISLNSYLFLLLLLLLLLGLQEYVQAAVQHPTKPIISFCTGATFACAVFDSKQVKCWGYGDGYGSPINYGISPSSVGDAIPYVNVNTSAGVEQVSCGYYHFCMRFNTNQIKCLGDNDFGQLGLGIIATPIGAISGHVGDKLPLVNIGTELQVLDIALGLAHSCFKVNENRVKCYGGNNYGQLGLSDNQNRGKFLSDMGDNLPFIDFGTDAKIASLHVGTYAYHSCVILNAPISSSQRIKCWGRNEFYQLGYGDMDTRGDDLYEMGDNLTLVDLGIESRVNVITLGSYHTCVLLINQELKCLGRGDSGQLASGSTATISATGNSIPIIQIDSGKTIKLLTSGMVHTCIVYDDKVTMKCFGYNFYGQLGQGDTQPRGESPITMIPNITAIDLGTGSMKIKSIHSGMYYTCIEFSDSSIKCFGQNNGGQFAIGMIDSPFNAIGNQADEMGNNLQFSQLFSPSNVPSTVPSQTPTLPTRSPTLPTSLPTKNPTGSPIITTKTSKPTSSDAIIHAKVTAIIVSVVLCLVSSFMFSMY